MSGKTHQLRRLVVFPNIYRSLMGEKSSQFTSIPSSSKEIHLRWCFFPNPKSSDFPKICASQKSSLCYVFSGCAANRRKKVSSWRFCEKNGDLFGMIQDLMPFQRRLSDVTFNNGGWKGQLPGLRWQSRDLAAPLGPADQSKLGRVNEWSSFRRNSKHEWLTSQKSI